MNNKRVEYMDTLKGLLIILVVFGHTGIDSSIQKWIYSFHMPLFLIISGFFYKESRDIISLKRIKRLVLPFIGFTILAIIFPGLPSLILKNKPIEWSKIFYLEERIFFNTPIWFLIVLFFIEIKINLINKITNTPSDISFSYKIFSNFTIRNKTCFMPWFNFLYRSYLERKKRLV